MTPDPNGAGAMSPTTDVHLGAPRTAVWVGRQVAAARGCVNAAGGAARGQGVGPRGPA